MSLNRESQQLQGLSSKLKLPIWENTINLPFRDLKSSQTLTLEKKFFFTWVEDKESTLIFISTQSQLTEIFQYAGLFAKKAIIYITFNQLIQERIYQFEESRSFLQSNFVSDFLRELLEYASAVKATDIHLELQQADNYKVQIRIHGELKNYKKIAPKGILLKVKLLSQMDIAKSRMPQDGYLSFQNKRGEKFDLRVSTLPSVAGEKMVIRILPLENLELEFKKLNFPKDFVAVIEKLIKQHSGWVLVAGPTGSGKTTTLYSIVKELRKKNLNIITIEDPVEYRLDGVTQVQVNEKIGISFSSILRSSLRQDPDVILVGEIRDDETAKIAAAAAKTGHLVLSTIHSGSVIETLQRIKFFKINSEDLASSLKLIIAQRLLAPTKKQSRVPVLEYLENNSKIKSAILAEKNVIEIEKIMKKQGFVSMQDYAKKVGVSLVE